MRSVRGYLLLLALAFALINGSAQSKISFTSSNEELTRAFTWAREQALLFAHDTGDPVGAWYEAALPNREAFCMRDVSHQAIGAELLGLSKHNANMFRKFAENISEQKDYCSYWEINRYNKPAPVDYENDKDFWYNLPSNFDVTYNAWRLYQWTGDRTYLDDPAFQRFYQLSLTSYIDRWKIGTQQLTSRERFMHHEQSKRFGTNRGIPTYNEGGRGETALGIDLTGSKIAAFRSYAEMLSLTGQSKQSGMFRDALKKEEKFLSDFWWDPSRNEFRSIQYVDGSFDYFMVGDNQAFVHYLLYFDAIGDVRKATRVVEQYTQNYQRLIVELKSYLPQVFYDYGHTQLANELVVALCSAENPRRDYPENSFAVVEAIARGLMGLNANARDNAISTISRLPDNEVASLTDVPVLGTHINIIHQGKRGTEIRNLGTTPLSWNAMFEGTHQSLFVNSKKVKGKQSVDFGRVCTTTTVTIAPGQTAIVSLE